MFKNAKYICTLYEEGNFTRAAEKLFISQPSLSITVANLEKKLGVKLFERTTAKLVPTVAGLEYIRTAKKISALEEGYSEYISSIKSPQIGGTVRIGVANFIFSNILLKLIEEFSEEYPLLTLSLTEASSSELERLLVKGDLDFVIDSYNTPKNDFSYTALRTEYILLAIPNTEKRKLNDEFVFLPKNIYSGDFYSNPPKSISIKEFKKENFILLKSGNNIYDHAMRVFEISGIIPRVIMLFDQLLVSLNHTKETNAACFITDTIFKYKKFDDLWKLYRIEECGNRTLGIIALKKAKSTAAMEIFKHMILEYFSK